MTMNQMLRYCAYIFAGAVFFVPLFISASTLFPFITGKNVLFRLLTLLIAAIVIVLIIQTRTYKKIPYPLWFVWGFVGTLLISNVQGLVPWRSFFSNFERMEGWFTLLTLGIFSTALYLLIEKRATWIRIWQISLVPNFYIIVHSLMQYTGMLSTSQSQGSMRPDSTLGNSSYVGGYTLMYAFLVAYLATQTRNVPLWIVYGLFFVLNVGTSFITLTRGSMLGIMVALTAMACIASGAWLYKKYTTSALKWPLAFLPVSIVIIAGYGLFTFRESLATLPFVESNRVLSRLATISPTDKSVEGRLINWGVSWEGVQERPLFGWGQENFLYVFSKYFDPKMAVYEPWYDRSHNVFFDWLIAGGVVGLVAYLSLYAVLLYVLWLRKGSKYPFSFTESLIWTGLLIAYFIHNVFVFDSIVSYILFFSIFAYIIWRSFAEGEKSVVLAKEKTAYATVIAGVLGVVIIMLLYVIVYLPWNTSTRLLQAMQLTTQGYVNPQLINDDISRAFTKQQLGRAYTKNEFGQYLRDEFSTLANRNMGHTEAREQLVQMALVVVRAPSIAAAEKESWARLAMEEIEKEMKKDPYNPRIRQLLANFYLQVGAAQQAVPLLEKAQELSPKKQLIMFDRAVAQQLLQNYEEALRISEEAYRLNENFLTAHARYVFALARVGNFAEVEKQILILKEKSLEQNYDLDSNGAFDDQLRAARVDYFVREALRAYEAGNMSLYIANIALIRQIDASSADRVEAFVATRTQNN